MAAPSKGFTVIPDTDVDADSPVNETLMVRLRDNDINLEEWLGKNFTPAVDHDHDNVNSKPVVSVGAGAIGVTELNLAAGSFTGTVGTSSTTEVTIDRYAHIRQSYTDEVNQLVLLAPRISGTTTFEDGIAFAQQGGSGSENVGINWDYHTN